MPKMIDGATDHDSRIHVAASHNGHEDATRLLVDGPHIEAGDLWDDGWPSAADVSPATRGEAVDDGPPTDVDLPVTSNLARVPIEQWGYLKVTLLSTFDDQRWDFRGMGSPLYTSALWGGSIAPNLMLPENVLRLCLLKAIVYYLLPHNNVLNRTRSYNSLATYIVIIQHLSRLFEAHNLYADVHGNGSYRSINDLDRTAIIAFLDDHISSLGYKCDIAVLLKFWHDLSAHEMLPIGLQLLYQPIDDATMRRFNDAQAAATQPFKPIPLDTLSLLVSNARRLIETNGADIIYGYESFVPILIWKRDGGDDGRSVGNEACERAITALQSHPSPLWDLDQFVDRPSGKIAHRKIRDHILNLTISLRGACMVIILAVTGMRGSEATYLEAGCAEPIGGGEYRLHVTVWKTSQASQGEKKRIPIPKIAYDAVKTLTELSAPARQIAQTPYICTTLTNLTNGHIGQNNKGMTYHILGQYCQRLGIEPAIHPHQFRKTIALFVIYRDPRHLSLLKHLFSHKSLRMTWIYITSIPGLEEDVKELLMEEHRALFNEIVKACETGQIGGKAGLRIKATLPQSPLFPGLLKDDDETIDQYIASLVEGGVALLHRTPYGVICTKTPGLTQRAPCDRPNAPTHRRFYPDLENCDPMECPFAVFTEASIPRLENDIRFHESMTDRRRCNPRQRRLSLRIIPLCKKRLAELRGEEAATVVVDGATAMADTARRAESHG